MVIVDSKNFFDVVRILSESPALATDTETTGLFPHKKDELFSIQFSDATEDYYFNFNEYENNEPVLFFEQIKHLQILFDDKMVFLQNAKFDMHFLAKEGIRFHNCDIHDTEVVARLIRNDHLKYNLEELGQREFGLGKDEAVMEWLKKNKKFTSQEIPGKDTIYKAYHFDQAPYEMITKYGCRDTRLTYDLGKKQLEYFETLGDDKLWGVYEMEKRNTRACYNIEKVGVQLDREYCEAAIKFESERIQKAEESFKTRTGLDIVDSGKCLGPVFEQLGFPPGRTESDEHEITDSFLDTVTDPLGKVVQEYRDARKRANTYFKSYLYYADAKGAIHADMRQAGTKTGRFSYRDPNLQNIPKEEDEDEGGDNSPFPVRRAFIPRPGYFLLSVDYNQMEFRMMLDEAGQRDLIDKINNGHDPHTATAELTGLLRRGAKILNFGLLYGMGLIKLAFSMLKNLTIEQKKALLEYERLQAVQLLGTMGNEIKAVADPIVMQMKQFKGQYFSALPMVQNFILQCSGAVKERSGRDPGNGWLKTWFGRRGYFNDVKFAYKAANFKIQGGCADVVKIAMNRLDDFLEDKASRMLIQIHDELLFEIAFEEVDLIDPIIKIMENVYPFRFIQLTCSMGYSLKSFYDIIDGDPRKDAEFVKEARDYIQRKSDTSASPAPKHLDSKNPATVT